MILRAAAARISAGLRAIFRLQTLPTPHNAISPSQTRLLDALLRGDTLKSHRYLDGGKEYRLHPLNGEAVSVPDEDVRPLVDRGLLLSNQKFPAATLILSDRGRRVAAKAKEAAATPHPAPVPADPSL
jgi:hypothetical protein